MVPDSTRIGVLVRWLLHDTERPDYDDSSQWALPIQVKGVHDPVPNTLQEAQRLLDNAGINELNKDGLIVHALAVQYADPKDKAYPIDKDHIHAAIDYFGKNAHRYPAHLQKEMAKRILRAAVRYGVEVGKHSKVREIAEGHHEGSGEHHPGKSHVAEHHESEPGLMESTAAQGLGSGNGPSGPHPIPHNPGVREAEERNAGAKELFDDIEKLRAWTESATESEAAQLSLVWDFLDAVQQIPGARTR